MEELLSLVNLLKNSLSDHMDSNNKKFAAIDAKLSSLGSVSSVSSTTEKGVNMSDGMTDTVKIHNAPGGSDPMAMMAMAMSGKGGGDGLFGAGGGGLLGGLLLGSLLRNGNLLGGADGAAGVSQPQANMSIMSTLGDIKQAVAVSTSAMEASQAQQSGVLQGQMSSIAAALTATVGGVKDAVNGNAVALMSQINGVDKSVMQSKFDVTQAINSDGDKTRALIVQQYEQTLTRQLSDANAALIELRSELNGDRRTRGAEVNVTQTVTQAQQQAQQQQQLGNLYNLLSDAVQSIRATNQAINIGAGTLTANPTNTNTNTRVN
jgi:hypothetical protein